MMGKDMIAAACERVNYRSECVNTYSLKGALEPCWGGGER